MLRSIGKVTIAKTPFEKEFVCKAYDQNGKRWVEADCFEATREDAEQSRIHMLQRIDTVMCCEEEVTLSEAQEYIGDYVEMINLPCEVQMLVGENARVIPGFKHVNLTATRLYGYEILGRVIILVGASRWLGCKKHHS